MKNKTLIYSVLLTGILSAIMLNCKKETPKTAPAVSIGEITAITASTADCAGKITFNGGEPVISYGICWSSTNANPTIWDSKTTETINSNSNDFNSLLQGLEPGTTYNVRAYASNSVGISYSNKIIFKTLAVLSTLNSTGISNLTTSSLSIESNITDDGGADIIARGICWSTSQNPTISDSKTTDGSGTGSFTSTILGLSPGTTYYFRAYATNSAGTSYGDQVTGKLSALATVTTGNGYVDSALTAGFVNNVTNDGGTAVTDRGICWSTNPNPTLADSKASYGTGTGSFLSYARNLVSGTTYYFRAFATNIVGTAYGNQVSLVAFKPILLTTTTFSNVTSTSLTSGGNITSDGDDAIIARGVCWSTHSNTTISDNKTIDGSGTGIFISSVTGLSSANTYFIRAYATNSRGTTYGKELSVTMAVGVPVVTTSDMSGVYTYSAKSGGVVSNDGGGSITARGVCWSINPNPTLNDNKSNNGTITGTFTSLVSILEPGTNYYVRAYASNSAGTAYGNEVSFKTNDAVIPTEDYLPLQVGNYWELSNGNSIHKLTIDKIENLDGLDYFRMIRSGFPWNDTVYFRKTIDGKIYQRGTKSTDEIVRFYLGGSSGDSWKYQKDPTMTWNDKPWTAKLISKSDTVSRSTVTFNDCYRFYYDIVEWADDPEWQYWLAPGKGFVKFIYPIQWTIDPPFRRLTKAKINGVEQNF